MKRLHSRVITTITWGDMKVFTQTVLIKIKIMLHQTMLTAAKRLTQRH